MSDRFSTDLESYLTNHGFECLESIGRGPKAEVFRCHHLESGTDMALKIWAGHSREFADESLSRHFFLNLKSHTKGRQTSKSVQIQAIAPRHRFVIMDLMNANITTHIQSETLAPEMAESILIRSLKCLYHIHERHNAIHGNLKPNNLFVDQSGKIRLGDSLYVSMNENRLIEDTQLLPVPDGYALSNATVMNTDKLDYPLAKYLSPEMINKGFGPIGMWIDQFMLGFTVFELLLGKSEFNSMFLGVGHEAMDVELGWLRWHGSSERMPSPYDVLPQLSPSLKEVLHRMTRKEVDKRFSNVAVAIGSLERERTYHQVTSGITIDPMELHSPAENRGGSRMIQETGNKPAESVASFKSSNDSLPSMRINRGKNSVLKTDVPFIDIPPERYTTEWWQEKWQEPKMQKWSKAFAIALLMLFMISLFTGSDPNSKVTFTSETHGLVLNVNGERVDLNKPTEYPVGKDLTIQATAENHTPLLNHVVRVIKSSDPMIIPLELKIDKYELTVNPLIENAKVLINGKNYPGNRGTFDVGTDLIISWSAPGYENEEKTWTVRPNTSKKWEYKSFRKLPRKREVVVRSTPEDAEVWSGNNRIGVAGKPFALNIGKHELKLIHADHQDLPLGEVLVDPGDEPLNLGQRSMKAKAARGFIEVSTEPPDAQVSYTALNHEGQEVPGLIPGDNGEVPVGSNWKIVATCKGNSQSKQVKVAEGLNQVRFELSISQRLTNNFGMQFVYIPPPEKPFEFGHVEKRLDFRKNNHPDSVHFSGFNSQFRFMERNALTPPALVVDGGRNSYPIKPVFYIPPTKVRVSMGFYVAENEVTLREWQKVMGSRPSFMKDIVPDDQPVTSVSRKEAYSFMRRAEQLEGLPMGTYRLLTDVEFDYIAKHGNAGIDHATLAETNRKRPGSATKMPVDAFGLHEIQGNVAELVEDYYSKDFHKKFYNQLDPVNFTYSNTGIARGCHYGISMKDHSLSFRMRVNENGRDPHVGFRVVRMRPSVDSESSGRLNTAAYSEHFNESDSDQNNDSKSTRNQIAGK